MFFRLPSVAHVNADSLAYAQSVFSNPVKHALGAYFTIQIVNLFGGIGISSLSGSPSNLVREGGFEPPQVLPH